MKVRILRSPGFVAWVFGLTYSAYVETNIGPSGVGRTEEAAVRSLMRSIEKKRTPRLPVYTAYDLEIEEDHV